MSKHDKKPTLEERVTALETHLAVLEAAAKKYLKMLRQAAGGGDD